MPRRSVPRRRVGARLASFAMFVAAGLMIASSARLSGGMDLRPSRNTDLVTVVTDAKKANDKQAATVAGLQADVDQLTRSQSGGTDSSNRLDAASMDAGAVAMKGPGVTVSLTDAPADLKPAGVDPDLLVVHQQDIQAVMNVLWDAGAEAMTVQGQRIGSTTGIKCVGNTVVIRGIPYAPPYEIAAIGDPDVLEQALTSSSFVKAYLKFTEAYGLGYSEHRNVELSMPAYREQQLTYARPA